MLLILFCGYFPFLWLLALLGFLSVYLVQYTAVALRAHQGMVMQFMVHTINSHIATCLMDIFAGPMGRFNNKNLEREVEVGWLLSSHYAQFHTVIQQSSFLILNIWLFFTNRSIQDSLIMKLQLVLRWDWQKELWLPLQIQPLQIRFVLCNNIIHACHIDLHFNYKVGPLVIFIFIYISHHHIFSYLQHLHINIFIGTSD